jgi:hypothetical protein
MRRMREHNEGYREFPRRAVDLNQKSKSIGKLDSGQFTPKALAEEAWKWWRSGGGRGGGDGVDTG